MVHKRIHLLLLTAILPILSPTLPVTVAQDGCASAGCHAGLLAGAHVHPATESCEGCHESVGSPHPQAGVKTFKLAQQAPGLCAQCHDLPGKKKVVHPPVQEGACTTCHDPHGASQPRLLTQPLAELCQSCHDDKASAAHVHGPVGAGDCAACHAAHESDDGALLVKPGDELCFGCHQEIKALTGKPHVHSALQAGCVSCHDAHGSAHPKLLAESGSQLCFQCHGDLEEATKSASLVHAPVRDGGCASCHSPHAGDNPKLLLKSEQDTCLGCHGAILGPAMTHRHGPIQQGRCAACHDPHSSRHRALLVKEYPSQDYAPYTPAAYELCFTCHNRDLLQYPDTSFATGFRDGDRNLHHLHVNRQKGRTCSLCHGIHGSATPKLIADSVPFGKWKLPLKYVKTETGGGCTPGCHKAMAYDREVPGRKPSSAQ